MNDLDTIYIIVILERVRVSIKNDIGSYHFICNEIKYATNTPAQKKFVQNYVFDNKPTGLLHKKIYNHKFYIKDKFSNDRDDPWWMWNGLYNGVETVVVNKERIKYLNILIKQLKKLK